VATWWAIPLAALTTCSTLAGGYVALRVRGELQTLIALTGGIVVAVALFDVLPEAINAVGNARQVTWLVGAGFLAFFLAERGLVLHHRDDEEHARAHHHVGALGAAGLSIHSFIDGLGIGLAFHLSTSTGLLVFIAVVSHAFARVASKAQRCAGWRSTQSHRCSAQSSARRLRSARRASGTCSRSTPGSFCSWAQPTCCRRRTSTRRDVASR